MSPLEESNDEIGIVQRENHANAAISHKPDAAWVPVGIESVWLAPSCNRSGLRGSDADLPHSILGMA
jgi:hypothetical protein